VPSYPKEADLPALLAALCHAGIEFIIVGGAAAVLQGVPITTIDLDIVHRRTPENVTRLLALLLSLDATMRYDFARRGLRPTAEMLAGTGQINLSTSLGPLDPLCELAAGQGYDQLLSNSVEVTDEGRTVRVLDLPTLIEVKTKAGRPKDRIVLPLLIATLQERDKGPPNGDDPDRG
jgi:hypothetical protein